MSEEDRADLFSLLFSSGSKEFFKELSSRGYITEFNFKEIVLFAIKEFGKKENPKDIIKIANLYAPRGVSAKEEWIKEAFESDVSLYGVIRKIADPIDATDIITDLYTYLGLSGRPEAYSFDFRDYKLYVTPDGVFLVRENKKSVSKRQVFAFYPERVELIVPKLKVLKEVEWFRYKVFARNTIMRFMAEGTFKDIYEELKERGLVLHRSVGEDALANILHYMAVNGLIEVKEEIPWDGFFLVEKEGGSYELVLVKRKWNYREVSKGELRKALLLLNELAEKWFGHVRKKFATVIKWAVLAPLSFVFKSTDVIKIQFPWLFLWGDTSTGKTTLGEIILHIWGLDVNSRMKSGSSIDTVPRLGAVLETDTFPIVINEPMGALQKDDIKEMIKHAVFDVVARSKFVVRRGRAKFSPIISLSPLVFTSNYPPPIDDTLLRRFVVISFSREERIPPSKSYVFDRSVRPKFHILSAIGYTLAKVFLEELSVKWFKKDWTELAEELLSKLYEMAGLEVPDWVKEGEIKTGLPSFEEDCLDIVREVFIREINRNRLPEHLESLRRKLEYALIQRMIPWAYLKEKGEEKVVILTTGFARAIRNYAPEIPMSRSLKSLAEFLGWEYKRAVRVGKKVMQGIVVPFSELAEFLDPLTIEEEVEEEEEAKTDEGKPVEAEASCDTCHGEKKSEAPPSVSVKVLEIVKSLIEERGNNDIHIDWVLQRAEKEGLDLNAVLQVISKLKRDGILASDGFGIWLSLNGK